MFKDLDHKYVEKHNSKELNSRYIIDLFSYSESYSLGVEYKQMVHFIKT